MIRKILLLFLIWRIGLIFVGIFAQNVPLGNQDRFLGGGAQNFHTSPEFFSWANFDGEHYLSISIHGYKFLEQAFFPVYPVLISTFAKPFIYDSYSALVYSILIGLLLSNIFFFLALIILWKLIVLDYPVKVAYLTIIVMLAFPTSFYFAALYNESLFLFLSILSFYLLRTDKLFAASLIGGISSATRIFGLLLLPSFAVEVWKKKNRIAAFSLSLIPLGLIIYMIYQWIGFGDPLLFYKLQKLVGEQHQSGITLLPQVYFRYIKMILTVDPANPIYQTVLLELLVGILFFLLPIYGYFKKVRLSYLVFAMSGFLLPTIQGSFSSVPRYVIVLFPSFLILAVLINKLPNLLKIVILSFSASVLMIETAMFLRGYWVA